MHWGVFAISAAHLYLPKLPLVHNSREVIMIVNNKIVIMNCVISGNRM